MVLKTQGDKTEFVYEVGSYFYPERSWVKIENQNAHLLAHEQLHFDITEIFARRLRQDLSVYEIGPNIKSELNRLYQRRERERRTMQAKFDGETRHGIHKELQDQWQEYVGQELKKTEDPEV